MGSCEHRPLDNRVALRSGFPDRCNRAIGRANAGGLGERNSAIHKPHLFILSMYSMFFCWSTLGPDKGSDQVRLGHTGVS